MNPPQVVPQSSPRLQLALKLALLASLGLILYLGGGQLLQWVKLYLSEQPMNGTWLLGLLLLAYIVFMAVPFMPGIEVGLVVMLAGGLEGVVTVYVATVIALTTSFLVGRLIPGSLLADFLGWLGLRRAEALIHEIEEMSPAERLVYLTRQAPRRWVPFLLRHRYLAIAVVLNTPGNAVIGGGGGIGMVAGLSGLFPLARYLALVALAVSPVPIMLVLNRLQ